MNVLFAIPGLSSDAAITSMRSDRNPGECHDEDVGVASGSDASMDLAGAPELPGSIGELEHMPMWLLLNIVVCGVVALCSAVSLLVRLCTTSDRGGPKYRVLSRDEAEADEDEFGRL